jgi:hypothetical protein
MASRSALLGGRWTVSPRGDEQYLTWGEGIEAGLVVLNLGGSGELKFVWFGLPVDPHTIWNVSRSEVVDHEAKVAGSVQRAICRATEIEAASEEEEELIEKARKAVD